MVEYNDEMKHVLLIEDNSDDITLTKHAIRKSLNYKYSLLIAKTGKEAIQLLRTSKVPDVILLDLDLPGINGFEVLKFIRENTATKTTPIIILSSSNSQGDIKRVYDLGANSFIQKTYDWQFFLQSIKTICLYWIKFNVTSPKTPFT